VAPADLVPTTTFSSKVDLHHAINCRVKCGSNLATQRSKIQTKETLALSGLIVCSMQVLLLLTFYFTVFF
jgi:hypothetical protein